ncbi:MAG: hypothetical protein LUG46_01075 [Erysipelotrichaceae bacterium]|nr:hypothetical protein [Erysipelotrichaceae bacterium]
MDFTYEDDKLVQYISKEYGFVDDELVDMIQMITFQDEDGGIYLVQLTTNMVIKYDA